MRHTCIVLAAAALVVALRAQDQPLPELAPFLAGVRAHLRTDRALLSQYTYLERRREIRLNLLGKVDVGAEKVFQVYPGLDRVNTYRRLIEVDGKPRDPRELEQDDLRQQKKVLDALQKRERESEGDRQKRERRVEKATRDEEATFDDLFRIHRMALVGRQLRDGRPMIVVEFAPRPDVVPQTDDGRLMKKMKGRAWVSEADFELARVDFEMLEDLSLGLVLGKLYKGAKASIERRKVNDEVWLPAEVRFDGSGRVLVGKFHIDNVVEYSEYRKFSVASDTTFKVPK